MSKPLPNTFQQFKWMGAPVAGGKLFSYAAATTNPLATYTDESEGTENANPTILSADGVASVWIPETTGYKFQLQDSVGNILWTVDNIFLIEAGSVGSEQIALGGVVSSSFADAAVTSAKFQDGAVNSQQIEDDAIGSSQINSSGDGVAIQNFDQNIDLTQLSNSVGCAIRRLDDPITGGRLMITPQYPNFTGTIGLLGTPGTLPAGAANVCKFSPDGRFLAVGHATTPFLTIYERSGTTFTKLANPSTLPAGTVNDLDWSPDGNLLVVANSTTPFMRSYQRRGLNFSALGTPGTIPLATGISASFSPNGELLIIGTDYDSGVTFSTASIYVTQGGSLLFISTAEQVGGGWGFPATAWSPDSQFVLGSIAPGAPEGPFTFIQQRAGVGFNPYLNFEVLEPFWDLTYGGVYCAAWSPDGNYLALSTPNSPYLLIYAWANQSLILTAPITLPAPIPQGAVNALCWSPNSLYLAIAYTGVSGCVDVYQNGFDGTFTQAWTALAPHSWTAATGVSWSAGGQFLAISSNSSPYIAVYEGSSSFPTNGSLYARNFADV